MQYLISKREEEGKCSLIHISSYCRRRPFLGQKLAKPRGAIYSNFYNKLGLGVINKDIIDDWIEYQNPLYKEEDDDYFYHELKKQSRELYIPPDWVETMNPLHSHYKID
jgi:hypothetical protein